MWGKDIVDSVVVMCSDKKHKLLSECDVVVCQIFNKQTSYADNIDILRSKYGKDKIVTISNHHQNLSGMCDRELADSIDIKFSSIYNSFLPKQTKMLTHNHPNLFVILESIRMICNYLNISFFDNIQYDNNLKDNWYNDKFYFSLDDIKGMRERRNNNK